jgi:hypothetical protein
MSCEPGATVPRCEWAPIPASDAAEWNRRLLAADAPLTQFPFWLQALRLPLTSPRYYCFASSERGPVAYAAVLAIGVYGFRIGVLNGGPVSLCPGEPVPEDAVAALWPRLRRSGYMCVRVANLTDSTWQAVCGTSSTENHDPFPWYSSATHMLVVEQREDDQEMLAGFTKHARQEIKKAAAMGYRIEATDSPEAIRAAWPLIEAMEARKGRQIYQRRCSSYQRLAELARPYGCSRIYLVRAGERLVQGIMVVRDGSTAHYVIGAVDVAALDRAVSPACLVHWVAMRDFYREGVRYYSLGNDNQGGLQIFKNKFRPRRIEYPPIGTLVINTVLYRLWKLVVDRLCSKPPSDEPRALEVPDHRAASS